MIYPELQLPTMEHNYNLRQISNLRPEYTNRYGFQTTITHCALTQLSMKRGLNKFKQKGEKAVTTELEQLHRRDGLQLVRTENLSEKQNHYPLDLLMFLKENRDESIKGCGVAGIRQQEEKIEPKDAASPTVSTEVFMLIATIDVQEGREVEVVDIPGAYLSADMDNEVHLVFRGELAEMMVATDQAL